MCFVIAIVLAIFSFNAFMADNILVGFISLIVSVFFIGLMIRNILHVKKIREEKSDN
jgi:FtsH-binding integral membrane protein